MAITKIWSVKSRLDTTLNYISNPNKTTKKPDIDAREGVIQYIKNEDKTEQCKYVAAYGCSVDTPFSDMLETQKRYERTRRKNEVIAYHIVQSFKKFETTPEIAHKCGKEFVERLFQDKYECVIATHLDHNHLHNHIVINSTSYLDGSKYKNNFKDYFVDIRGISDQICIENCLSVITNPKHRGMSYCEWKHEKAKTSIRWQVRIDLDEIIKASYTMKDFWKILEERGFQVTRRSGKYKFTSFIPPNGTKRIRLDKLGPEYTEEAIRERIKAVRNGIRTASPTELDNVYEFGSKYKHLHPKRLKGFMALYYHYLYLFGKIRKKQTPQRVSFFMREELTKFERYKKQFEFLYEHHIETVGELVCYHKTTESKIAEITEMRKELYAQRTEENKDEINNQARIMNKELRKLRAELSLCKNIYKDSQNIKNTQSRVEELRRQAELEEMENEHKRRSR